MYKLKLKLKFYGYSILGVFDLLLILSFAFLQGKLFEIATTIVLFFLYRSKFEKQYHAKSLITCGIISFIVFVIVTLVTIKKTIAILAIVITTYFINLISFYVRDYLDIARPQKKKKNTNRQIIVNILGNNLDEESVEEFCTQLGFPKLSETIYLFIHNTLEETAELLDIDCSTVTRRINKFIKESRK